VNAAELQCAGEGGGGHITSQENELDFRNLRKKNIHSSELHLLCTKSIAGVAANRRRS
jgi:hypothetical protein